MQMLEMTDTKDRWTVDALPKYQISVVVDNKWCHPKRDGGVVATK